MTDFNARVSQNAVSSSLGKVEVIPSLPAASLDELRTKIGMVRGLVSTFQIDVTDGVFAPAVSWPLVPGGEDEFQKIANGVDALPFWEDVDFEVHFMAHHPETMIPDWIRAGAIRALIHIEAEHDFNACRTAAGEVMELGVSLNIGTPISKIDGYIEHISVVQLMGIAKIGSQGQPFDPRVLDGIREVKKRYPNVIIEIDGAVNAETAPLLVEAGATRLAPGSYVLRNENPKAAIENLKALT